MSRPVAVLDACTLVPIRVATTLLWLAEAGLYRPLWSERILDEVARSLPKVGITERAARRRVNMMRDAFGTDAMIDDYEGLESAMTCDAKDRHVLAAAVHAEADTLVTFNLRDFPEASALPYGVTVTDPDAFLTRLLERDPQTVLETVRSELRAFRVPPTDLHEFLGTLRVTAPSFADEAGRIHDAGRR